ncbi:MAG: hypothetical protein V3S07_09680 [Micropepsaceae bacterium]
MSFIMDICASAGAEALSVITENCSSADADPALIAKAMTAADA